MDKAWVVEYKRGSKKRRAFYNTETELLKNIKSYKNADVIEYSVVSAQSAESYLSSRERDIQLRTILGDLSKAEESSFNLIRLLESLPDDPNDRYSNRKKILNRLKLISQDKKAVAAILVKNKKFLFNLCDSVEWLVAILRCHNFTTYNYDSDVWDASARKYVPRDTATETLKQNFKLAKLELRKK